jgi:hypothetical protein
VAPDQPWNDALHSLIEIILGCESTAGALNPQLELVQFYDENR